jgi:membrane protease YdiL (CAAX protease family)
MHKNYYWIIELIIIIVIFALTLQIILIIGSNRYSELLCGFIINIVVYIFFLLFAIYRLIGTRKKNHSLAFLVKKQILPKDILSILLIVIIGPITYGLIMEIGFVHIFGIVTLSHNIHITSFQALSMLFLYIIFIPTVALSEEFYFRSYLFEIQYANFKQYTWVINGFSWSIFHLFTPTNFLAFLPTCLLYSYIYQKRKNIWITIIAHLITNFIAFYPLIRKYISHM